MRDEMYMRRCFDLARLGRPYTRTNPLVGSCIVYNNRIIGEGYHKSFGGNHGEIEAINSVNPTDKQYLRSSTLYVNLAPCNHSGKTPPCTAKIIELGIPKVVIGTDDLNPIAGGGIDRMTKAGIEVVTGVLEKESKRLIHSFFIGVTQQRPFITLKWAQSRDGFIGRQNERVAISSPGTQLFVHDLRRLHNAILIGGGTAITDNPKLTTRVIPGPNPLRVVLQGTRTIPSDWHLMSDAEPTLRFTNSPLTARKKETNKLIESIQDLSIEKVIKRLYEKYEIGYLLVEGGTYTLNQFIQSNLWDACYVIGSDLEIKEGIRPPIMIRRPNEIFKLGTDHVSIYTQ